MTELSGLQDELLRDEHKHMVIVQHHGDNILPARDELAEIKRLRPESFFCTRLVGGNIVLESPPIVKPTYEADQMVKELMDSAGPSIQAVRLMVDVGKAPNHLEICKLLQASRSFSQERFAGPCHQLVLMGAINVPILRRVWHENGFKDGSAPLDEHRIFKTYRQTSDTLCSILRARNLMTKAPDTASILCANTLLDLTAGDTELIECILGRFNATALNASTLQKLISSLSEQLDLFDVVIQRVRDLPDAAKRLLVSILLRGVTDVGDDQEQAEDLQLRGLCEISHVKHHPLAKISSFCTDVMLRRKFSSDLRSVTTLVQPGDLLPQSWSTNQQSFQILFEVENLLRNLVVSEYQKAQGAKYKWQDMLDAEVRDTAECLKKQEKGRPALTRSDFPLSAYLDFGSLKEEICNQEKYDKFFKVYFPVHHEIQSWLESLNAIRIAVAHNRPISVETYDRLLHIRDDIITRVAQAR